jgi:hypothetical protein
MLASFFLQFLNKILQVSLDQWKDGIDRIFVSLELDEAEFLIFWFHLFWAYVFILFLTCIVTVFFVFLQVFLNVTITAICIVAISFLGINLVFYFLVEHYKSIMVS